MQKSRERAFRAEESVSAKVLRQEGTYSVQEIERRPVWLDLRGGEGVGEGTGGSQGPRVTVRPLAFPLRDAQRPWRFAGRGVAFSSTSRGAGRRCRHWYRRSVNGREAITVAHVSDTKTPTSWEQGRAEERLNPAPTLRESPMASLAD